MLAIFFNTCRKERAAMEKVVEIKKLLRGREFDKALILIMDIMDKAIININNMGNNNEVLKEFTELLNHLEHAIKVQDVIRICDILEYIIVPFFEENNVALEG